MHAENKKLKLTRYNFFDNHKKIWGFLDALELKSYRKFELLF